jgi:hypothetical protein
MRGWYAQEIRAAPVSIPHRHGRANAKFPRLVAGRCDDTPVRGSADDQGFVAKLGIVALFDRRIERVHINMQDAAR